MPKCPGQDPRMWRPEDIVETPCPDCGAEMEFFKMDKWLPCPECGRRVLNPRFDPGCAAWCRFAESCLGREEENEE